MRESWGSRTGQATGSSDWLAVEPPHCTFLCRRRLPKHHHQLVGVRVATGSRMWPRARSCSISPVGTTTKHETKARYSESSCERRSCKPCYRNAPSYEHYGRHVEAVRSQTRGRYVSCSRHGHADTIARQKWLSICRGQRYLGPQYSVHKYKMLYLALHLVLLWSNVCVVDADPASV
ncbi:hypothetical protein BDV95DRAFT_264065 [Massariosphaeria phaeospora]|uniref:Uncharacterized protein n=1 Tax=Massariosphaeria phaeospora TaxID=100035 RepID=A0A7C8HYL5_9PLEO|nr:hypothetical protein BDV95DRAFT_264065 [Massariosphaeria phaeospora]